jgi:predicted ATPase/class 3 adenylate cyclase
MKSHASLTTLPSGKPLASGTLAFLFTDIEGSTALWESNAESMRAALARHDRALRAAMLAHGGHVFRSRGDSYCATFAAASQAIAAALAAQRAVNAEDFSDVGGVRVRMAVHAGAAESRDNDYYGSAVNRVARLLSIAHGGQVLLSRAALELGREELPCGATTMDLGQYMLRGLTLPETVYQLVAPGLTDRFPPLKTSGVVPDELPRPPTSLVGRDLEIEGTAQLLRRQRLVTLTGPGGVGKTRVALEAAARAMDGYRDGAWFVDLTRVECAERVEEVVAGFLGLSLSAPRPHREALLEFLRGKRMLLVLDNCEHLVQACAELVSALLRGCPGLAVLATSREVLGVSGEQLYRIEPFALPPRSQVSAQEALALPAVRLFLERARGARGEFAFDDVTAPVVVELCRELDGLPLAIEMAATRARMLPPWQLVQLLARPLCALSNGERTAATRHRTLEAVADWSWQLLPRGEQLLLARLALLPDEWDIDVVMQAGVDGLAQLASLVDKSLVGVDFTSAPPRYRMLKATRRHALAHAAREGLGGLEAARQRPPIQPGHQVLDHARAELREHRVVHEAQVRSEHDVLAAG